MHTTGLAAATIGRLYEGDRLCRGLRDARARTLATYSHLDLESLRFPLLDVVNPPVWELSHIAWFQEYWCLRYSPEHGGPRKGSMLRQADALFDSSRVAHDSRWTLPYPPLKALRDYMRDTHEATLEALAKTPQSRRYFFALALLHEDMHDEALLMSLQALGLPAPPTGVREPPPSIERAATDIEFAAGAFEQGTPQGDPGFAFDNEKWAHPVRVGAFRIADRPVTQGEYAGFVEAGGAQAPAHWRREAHGWSVRRFDRWFAMDPHAPMVQASQREASEYCRWARRRLPTEAEWEYAARNGGARDRFPWGDEAVESAPTLDFRHAGPSSGLGEPQPSRSGLRGMIGGVWEWTSTPFGPYPGFQPDPYKEYSQPWFGDHFVLRGGSFATRSRLVHNRFRNFYLPRRADIFAGFRTCAV